MILKRAQAVKPTPLQKLRNGDWRSRSLPDALVGVPTMLLHDEIRLLEFLTEEYWNEAGSIIDAGCFLGGSTLALASGLRARGIVGRPLVQSYDLFQVEDWTRGFYFPASTRPGDCTRALFDRNIAPFADLIAVHHGNILDSGQPDGPIEIAFIDIAKNWQICDWITANFFPKLIAGQSVVIQQDYLFPSWTGWLQITMEHFAENFEIVCTTDVNSVVFLHTQPFAAGSIKPALVASMPREQHVALLDAAAQRFDGEQHAILRSAGAHFMQLFHGE